MGHRRVRTDREVRDPELTKVARSSTGESVDARCQAVPPGRASPAVDETVGPTDSEDLLAAEDAERALRHFDQLLFDTGDDQ